MTLNRFCLLVAVAAGVAALQGAPLHAQTCAKATGSNTCVYAVKYICGYQAPSERRSAARAAGQARQLRHGGQHPELPR